ncbi:MAG: sugar transferase [Myxococcota bacterium]|nr:sugar transferase [Myxococcota bacterium]
MDLAAFFTALNIAVYLRYDVFVHFFLKAGPPPWAAIIEALPWVMLCWIAAHGACGSYEDGNGLLGEIAEVIKATLITFVCVLAATFFYRNFSYSRGMMAFLVPAVVVCSVGGRILVRSILDRARLKYGGVRRVIIWGTGERAYALVRAMEASKAYQVVALMGEPRKESLPDDIGVQVLDVPDDLDSLFAGREVDTLVLAEPTVSDARLLATIEACLRHHVTWNMVPTLHELLVDHARVELVDGIPVVGMRRSRIVGFNWMVKRLFDMVASSLLLLLLSPMMLMVAVAIRMSSSGPVFYTQQRVGYRGEQFPFFKFRSMHVNNDDQIHRDYTKQWITENQAHSNEGEQVVHKIVDDPRIFPVGKFIRRFSIDELPQLFNVLRGDMSLIGPRPALPYEVEVYSEWHRRRFEAPPGITGLWQVSGRNRLSFEEMIALDIDYLENWSLYRDIRILFRTIGVVLFEKAY